MQGRLEIQDVGQHGEIYPEEGHYPIARILSADSKDGGEGFLSIVTPRIGRGRRGSTGNRSCPRCGKQYESQSHPIICRGLGAAANKVFKTHDPYYLTVIPSLQGREVGLIVGPSGAGKTVFTSEYATEYLIMYPMRQVFIMTGIDGDRSFMELSRDSRVHFIKIDKSLIDAPLTLENFADSLTIFDDIVVQGDKALTQAVEKLITSLVSGGRHNNASVLVTNHQASECNKPIIRTVTNEAHFYVVFPSAGKLGGIERLLKTHAGLDKETYGNIILASKESRWVYIHTAVPNFIVYELGARIY